MPSREPPERFPVSFYIVAMLFIMFDIEIIFIYPFAVDRAFLGTYAFWAMLAFSVVFFAAFVYVVARGGLDWGPLQRAPARPRRRDRVGRAHARSPRSAASAPRAAVPTEERRSGMEPWIVNDVRDDGLGGIQHNVITGQLEDLVNWSRSRSSRGRRRSASPAARSR